MNILIIFVSLVIIILYLIYVLVHRKFSYWKNKNVPYLEPIPFLGNYGKYMLLQEYVGHMLQRLCHNFPDAPYFGAFFGTEPVLIVQSPQILRHILTKDFYHFNGREISKYGPKETITNNLFFAGGNRWKIARQSATPLFSSAKMKKMFYLIEKCCHLLEEVLDREINASDVIEVRQFSARYTMDCICSCAFGIEANTLLEHVNNPFNLIAKEIFGSSSYTGFKMIFRAVWPAVFYKLGFKYFPATLDVFFGKLLQDIIISRNYKPSPRNDFVDLILGMKNSGVITIDSITNTKTGLDEKVQFEVNEELIISQCVGFFGAGFETSATTLSFTLYELAKNQEVQNRAATEVDEYLRRNGNKLNYECVNELPYLEACLFETIRIYPVLGHITREVMDDCVLPDGLFLDKGVRIHIPVYYLHHNPNYFPEPETYKPERFLSANKDNVKQFTFLPFGEGPRFCTGKRFALMQVLPGMVSFLKKYRVELAENMPKTVTFESRSFLTQPKEQGLMLKFFKREGWEQRQFVRN